MVNGKIFESSAIPIIGQRAPVKHALGGVAIDTPNSPAELLGQAGGMTSDTAALWVATSLELQTRDAEIAALKQRIDRLVLIAGTGLDAIRELELRLNIPQRAGFPVTASARASLAMQPDAETLEHDHRERIDRVRVYVAAQRQAWSDFASWAKIRAPGNEDPASMTLDDLRKAEAWLDRHGGAGWNQ